MSELASQTYYGQSGCQAKRGRKVNPLAASTGTNKYKILNYHNRQILKGP